MAMILKPAEDISGIVEFSNEFKSTSELYQTTKFNETPTDRYLINGTDILKYCATNPRFVTGCTFGLPDAFSGYERYNFVRGCNDDGTGCWGQSYGDSFTANAGTYYLDGGKVLAFADPHDCCLPIPSVANSTASGEGAPFKYQSYFQGYCDISLYLHSISTTFNGKRFYTNYAGVQIRNSDGEKISDTPNYVSLGKCNGVWILLQAAGGGGGGSALEALNWCGGGGGSGGGALIYVNLYSLYKYNSSYRVRIKGGGDGGAVDGGIGQSLEVWIGNSNGLLYKKVLTVGGGNGGTVSEVNNNSMSKTPAGGTGGQVTINDNTTYRDFVYIASTWSGNSGGSGSLNNGVKGSSYSRKHSVLPCSGDYFYLNRTANGVTYGAGTAANSDGATYGGGGGGSACSVGGGGKGRCYISGATTGEPSAAYILATEERAPSWELKPPRCIRQITRANVVVDGMLQINKYEYTKVITIINDNAYDVEYEASPYFSPLAGTISANGSVNFTRTYIVNATTDAAKTVISGTSIIKFKCKASDADYVYSDSLSATV